MLEGIVAFASELGESAAVRAELPHSVATIAMFPAPEGGYVLIYYLVREALVSWELKIVNCSRKSWFVLGEKTENRTVI